MSVQVETTPMGTLHRLSVQLGDHQITIETGKFAEQAGGAVLVRAGDTTVFATATMSRSVRPGIDFFPLSVDYEEKMYAAGRIPGSFFRREGRPSEQAILTARVIDRPLRPLFPDDLRNEVQVILTAFSADQEHHIDMLGLIAASAAVHISDVPWGGPVAGVRIGLINGELVVNPTIAQMENSTLDLRVAGTAEAINMVECAADEVPEDIILRALKLAHERMQPVIAAINELREQVGKPKASYVGAQPNQALAAEMQQRAGERIRQILAEQTDKVGRSEALDALKEEVVALYGPAEDALTAPEDAIGADEASEAFSELVKKEVRRRILEDGIRPDGRTHTEIRPLAAEVGIIPRVHGSGLFKRGQTQVLSLATLGTPGDAQELDGLHPEDNKRYMHHYNMPPYSTGEAIPLRGPKRREIGHGALAEAALRSMIPPADEFPYTLRVVSEVLSSNGSTSMASVCASTLALMDAGVPIKRPVAGIAMGLIKEGDKVAILTDIQGLEDHMGDMDFKVAGTERGITALQMDIKITGVSDAIMAQALNQAHDARMKILEVIKATIPQPRAQLSDYAPRIITIKIDVEKIGAVIGPGGKTVRAIQDRTGAKIDIEEDGTIFVSSVNGPSAAAAVDEIRGLTEDAEIGKIYTGRVTRVESYGAFVEFLPGKEGMVHISQLADYRVAQVSDEVSVGDEIMVMVISIEDGKVRLSRQAVLEGWTAEEARARDRRGGGDRGGSRGGGDRGGERRGGGDRGNRGGDRRY